MIILLLFLSNSGCSKASKYYIVLTLPVFFYVLLTVHLGIILFNDQLDAKFYFFFFFNMVISVLYMFRAFKCLPVPVAARKLRSCVRIPPVTWMFVYCECCVLSGSGLCIGLITRPEESYRMWCVVVCVLET